MNFNYVQRTLTAKQTCQYYITFQGQINRKIAITKYSSIFKNIYYCDDITDHCDPFPGRIKGLAVQSRLHSIEHMELGIYVDTVLRFIGLSTNCVEYFK